MIVRLPLFLAVWLVAAATLAGQAPASRAAPAREPRESTRAPASRPNLVLILADDLGYGELGVYGQARFATPRLDRMAAEGVRCTAWYASAPVCAPSRASLMTGLHLGHAPIRDNREVKPEGQAPLPADVPTLPRLLSDAGYDTAMIGKWGLGAPGSVGEPGRHGFSSFFGYLCQREAHHFYPDHLWRLVAGGASVDAARVDLPGNRRVSGATHAQDLFREEVRRFVAARAERPEVPFFLYLPFTLPHLALQPPPEDLEAFRGRFPETPYDGGRGYLAHPTPRAAYAAMIARLDADVGVLLDALTAAGLDRDTVVVFTSDNGPTHDVGGVDTEFFRSAGPFRGRKGSCYEGGLRVPCLVRGPGRFPAGRVVDAPGAHYDFLATFAALAGTNAPPGDGRDASPDWRSEVARPPRAPLYWEFPGYGGWQAVRDGRFKLVRRALRQGPVVEELFDLETDPSERRDLARDLPTELARLRALAAAEHRPDPEYPLEERAR
jgi:arylsulfatase